MKFNQFVIAPWIGDGFACGPDLRVDNLEVSSAAPAGVPLSPRISG
jgi:hypothetical protein